MEEYLRMITSPASRSRGHSVALSTGLRRDIRQIRGRITAGRIALSSSRSVVLYQSYPRLEVIRDVAIYYFILFIRSSQWGESLVTKSIAKNMFALLISLVTGPKILFFFSKCDVRRSDFPRL